MLFMFNQHAEWGRFQTQSSESLFYRAHVFAWRNRIIESFEFKDTIKGLLVQLPFSEEGHLQLDYVAQSPV